MLIAHPKRLVQWKQLHVDCAGDEVAPDGDGVFSRSSDFHFFDGKVRFDANLVSTENSQYGSASGFVSQ
jgi:hypothetical protein